jgi:hypothetical protein
MAFFRGPWLKPVAFSSSDFMIGFSHPRVWVAF